MGSEDYLVSTQCSLMLRTTKLPGNIMVRRLLGCKGRTRTAALASVAPLVVSLKDPKEDYVLELVVVQSRVHNVKGSLARYFYHLVCSSVIRTKKA